MILQKQEITFFYGFSDFSSHTMTLKRSSNSLHNFVSQCKTSDLRKKKKKNLKPRLIMFEIQSLGQLLRQNKTFDDVTSII